MNKAEIIFIIKKNIAFFNATVIYVVNLVCYKLRPFHGYGSLWKSDFHSKRVALWKSDFNSYNRWVLVILLAVIFYYGSPTSIVRAAPFDATNFMTLFFHSEAADFNSTYNTLSMTPPEPTGANTTAGSATTDGPIAVPCEADVAPGATVNEIITDNDLADYDCVATF